MKSGDPLKKAKNAKLLAYLSLGLVVLAWGISPIVGKYMLTSYSPGIKRVMDALFATIALGAIAGKHLIRTDKNTVLFSLLVGLCFSLGLLLEGVGINYTTPAKSTFFGNVTCITVPIFAAIFAKKLPGPLKVLSGVICLAGFGVIIFGGDPGSTLPSFALGDALTLLSGVFYGATVAMTGTWGRSKNTLVVTFFEFLVSIPMCILYVVLFEKVAFSWSLRDLAIIAASAVVVQALCWLLRNFALRHLDAGFVAIATSFSMVVSGVVSVLVGMDTFSWALCIGGVICLVAVILSSLPQHPKA